MNCKTGIPEISNFSQGSGGEEVGTRISLKLIQAGSVILVPFVQECQETRGIERDHAGRQRSRMYSSPSAL